MAKTCATIGCKAAPTHTLVYTNPGERDDPITELVCAPCGHGYVSRKTLKATITPLPVKRARGRNKLFVWHGVMRDYTAGMIVALAPDVETAIAQVQATNEWIPSDLIDDMRSVKPEVHEVTAGNVVVEYVRGGG